MSGMGLQKCKNCIHFEEEVHKTEDGKKEYRLYCGMTGKDLPGYNASPETYCYGFKWNAEAWREYAE